MQNEQIEEDFFEAFGIESKILTDYNDCDMKCNTFDNCLECKRPKITTKKKIYPPITPEIVLKLEEILLNTFQNFKYKTGIENNTYSNGIKGIIGCFCSNKIPFKGNNYFLGRADSYEWAGIGDNRLDALLNLCIQLKDEIQDQVRTLFKC